MLSPNAYLIYQSNLFNSKSHHPHPGIPISKETADKYGLELYELIEAVNELIDIHAAKTITELYFVKKDY